MKKVIITQSKDDGRLLLIEFDKERQPYHIHGNKAAKRINDLSNRLFNTKVVEKDDLAVISSPLINVIFDPGKDFKESNAMRIRPFLEKVLSAYEKKRKIGVNVKDYANKVLRNQDAIRNKVVQIDSGNYMSRAQKAELYEMIRGKNLAEFIHTPSNFKIIRNAGLGVIAATTIIAFTSQVVAQRAKNDSSVYGSTSFDTEPYSYSAPAVIEPEDITEYEETVVVPETTEAEVEDEFEGLTYSYEDRTNNKKYQDCLDNYGDLIKKYAEMYGVDTNLAIAIATQERGVHSSIKDNGGGVGLFQVQESVWLNNKISAYNFQTGEKDSILVTKDNIGDLESNIRFGVMIIATCYNQMYGNIPATIQCYNYGYGNMTKVYNKYAYDLGLEDFNRESTGAFTDVEKRLLCDQNNTGWMKPEFIRIVNKNGYEIGDAKYLAHIFSYMGDEFDITFQNRDGSVNSMSVRSTRTVSDIKR